MYITGSKYAGDIGRCSVIDYEIASVVHLQLADEEGGVWAVADRQKEPASWQTPDFSGDDISDADTGHDILSKNIFDDAIPDKGNFFILAESIIEGKKNRISKELLEEKAAEAGPAGEETPEGGAPEEN